MSNGHLDQVAGAVQFMQVTQIGPAFRRPLVHKVGVEVAAGLLGSFNNITHLDLTISGLGLL